MSTQKAQEAPKTAEEKAAAGSDVCYTVVELCRAEKRLGASCDIIRAALLEQGIWEATIEQAKQIVSAFKSRRLGGKSERRSK